MKPLTVTDIATALKYSRPAIYKMLACGRLPGARGNSGHLSWEWVDLVSSVTPDVLGQLLLAFQPDEQQIETDIQKRANYFRQEFLRNPGTPIVQANALQRLISVGVASRFGRIELITCSLLWGRFRIHEAKAAANIRERAARAVVQNSTET
jgi:hypothetical protein